MLERISNGILVEEEKITGRRLECYYRDNDIITSLPAQEEELGVTKRKHIKMEGGVEKERLNLRHYVCKNQTNEDQVCIRN